MTVMSDGVAAVPERRAPTGEARSLATAARTTSALSTRWTDTYVRRLKWTGASAVLFAVAVAQFARFGSTDAVLGSGSSALSYTVVSVILGAGWIVALALFHTWDNRVVGSGPDEYRRVAHASLALFGTVAIVAFLGNQDLALGYVAVALSVGLLTLTLGRWLWRRWLVRRRAEGEFTSTVLVVGSHPSFWLTTRETLCR